MLVITTEPKTIHFDLSHNVGSLKDEIDFNIKHNELLAVPTIKNEIRQFLSKHKHRYAENTEN